MPTYPSSNYSAPSYPAPATGGGFADGAGYWDSAAEPLPGGYRYPSDGYQGGYRDSYGGGYAPPPPQTDNPWAGAAAGYSREPAEDFREQRRRENPWAFERPDPAREAERRRWREQPERPWAREGDGRYQPAPAGGVYPAPSDPAAYGAQGYRGSGYEYGYPGYGRGDGYYPGGGYDPWSTWGRGMPGGSWGGWPSMPWSW